MKATRSLVLILLILVAQLITTTTNAAVVRTRSTANPTAATPGWNVVMVDNTSSAKTGWRPSIAIHPVTQQPYVSYHDVTNGALRLAKREATGMGSCGSWGWNCVELNNLDRSGESSSIGFVPGGNGAYALAYNQPDYGAMVLLQVAANGTYSHEVIGEVQGPAGGNGNEVIGFPSLAFRNGEPRVVFHESVSREYPSNTTPDIRISGSVYRDRKDDNDAATGYIDMLVTDDEHVPVDYGYYPSLDFGANTGTPRIGYRGHNQRLQYAEYNAAYQGVTCFDDEEEAVPDWHCRTVDPAPKTGYYITHKAPRLIGNTYSHTQIAYHDAANGLLKYAQIVGGNATCGAGGEPGWQCNVIDNVGTSNGPMGAAMALDSKGRPVIAYYDRNDTDHGVLKVARLATDGPGNCGPQGDLFKSWNCITVDDGGSTGDDVGQWAAIALDADDKAYVAYYNSSYQALMVAHEKSDVLPQFTASHNPGTVQQGGSTTLTYTLKHTNPYHGLSGLNFTHNLVAHRFVPGTLQTTCGSSQISFVLDNHAIKLTSATLAPNSTCTIKVKVQIEDQSAGNTGTSALKSNEANEGAAAQAPLTVVGPNTPVPTSTPVSPPEEGPSATPTTPDAPTSMPTIGNPNNPTSTPTTGNPNNPTSTPTTGNPNNPTSTPTTGSPGTISRVYLPFVRR